MHNDRDHDRRRPVHDYGFAGGTETAPYSPASVSQSFTITPAVLNGDGHQLPTVMIWAADSPH